MTDNIQQTFKTADIVKLKSGSPNMIVENYVVASNVLSSYLDDSPLKYRETTIVNVTWFDGAKKKKGQFEQALLELA